MNMTTLLMDLRIFSLFLPITGRMCCRPNLSTTAGFPLDVVSTRTNELRLAYLEKLEVSLASHAASRGTQSP